MMFFQRMQKEVFSSSIQSFKRTAEKHYFQNNKFE